MGDKVKSQIEYEPSYQHLKNILGTKEKCYYLKATMVGDEICYWCKLSDHPCVVEYNEGKCEYYEEM